MRGSIPDSKAIYYQRISVNHQQWVPGEGNGQEVLLTISCVIVSMVMTVLCAYPMAEAGLKGKGILWPYFIFYHVFFRGMIPSYLLVNHLGLIDSMLALILPGMISTYNMIVMFVLFFHTGFPEGICSGLTVQET